MSEAPQRPRVREEFLAEFLALGKAIDNLLVGHHGLRHSLDSMKRVAVPFTVSEVTAMEAFGVGSPLFHLWNECRLVEALRVAWTGQPSSVQEGGDENVTGSEHHTVTATRGGAVASTT